MLKYFINELHVIIFYNHQITFNMQEENNNGDNFLFSNKILAKYYKTFYLKMRLKKQTKNNLKEVKKQKVTTISRLSTEI